jgi:hypothetical protein
MHKTEATASEKPSIGTVRLSRFIDGQAFQFAINP